MKLLLRKIKKFEKKHYPKFRKNRAYVIFKILILSPIILLILAQRGFNAITIKRADKPDIKMKNIVNGWKNLVIDNPVVERVAIHRANICAECPFAVMSTGVHTVVVDNKTTQIRGLKCSKCGCPLSAKVRSSFDYCPIGKW